MSAKNQYSVRCDPGLIASFKARAEATGYNHPEVLRMLMREFAYGRLNIGISSAPVAPTATPPNLGDMLR